MSERSTPPTADHLLCGPDALFRLGPVQVDDESAHGTMRTGPWILGPEGVPTLGAVGVLTDAMFGSTVFAGHGADRWVVSTELILNMVAPLPTDGSELDAESRTLSIDADGGLGSGVVRDARGRVVVAGTQRLRFVPRTSLPRAPVEIAVDPETLDRTADQTMLEVLGVGVGGDGMLQLPTVPQLANPVGNLHGGVLVAVSEVAGLRAVQSAGAPLQTAAISVVFLRPGPVPGRITFRTETQHRGRTLALVRVTAVRPDGKACAISTVTCEQARPSR